MLVNSFLTVFGLVPEDRPSNQSALLCSHYMKVIPSNLVPRVSGNEVGFPGPRSRTIWPHRPKWRRSVNELKSRLFIAEYDRGLRLAPNIIFRNHFRQRAPAGEIVPIEKPDQ